MSWIQLHSNFPFDYMNIVVDGPLPIFLDDISHALSNLGRYCGHSRRFYSVGEHSVLVSEWIEQLGGGLMEQKWGLLHDATEAYLQDIPSPLKHAPQMAWYREMEERLKNRIMFEFQLPQDEPLIVKQSDMDVLEAERRVLLGESLRPWTIYSTRPAQVDVVGLTPEYAKKKFMMRAVELGLAEESDKKWWRPW